MGQVMFSATRGGVAHEMRRDQMRKLFLLPILAVALFASTPTKDIAPAHQIKKCVRTHDLATCVSNCAKQFGFGTPGMEACVEINCLQ
jgi:hypothetical protein